MQADQLLRFGPYRFDSQTGQLWRGTLEVKLTPKALAVLGVLVTRPGQVVTKDDFFQTVWADTVVSDEALTSCIQELRQALHDDARKPRFIETVHRRGCRFLGKVVSSQHSGVSRTTVASDQSSVISPPLTPLLRSQLTTENWQLTTPLVGRDAELTQLHGLLEKAIRGERQIVFVTGEPGIGKTTLLNAFRQRLETGGWRLVPSPQASKQVPKSLLTDIKKHRAFRKEGHLMSLTLSYRERRALEELHPRRTGLPGLAASPGSAVAGRGRKCSRSGRTATGQSSDHL
jgi:DNA-binding winged helix-turn-helix (wHTH) protein